MRQFDPEQTQTSGRRTRRRSARVNSISTRRQALALDWSKVGLGTKPDVEIARELGVASDTVGINRRKLGIPAFKTRIDWSKYDAKISCASIARELGVSQATVNRLRNAAGAPGFSKAKADWDNVPLGEKSDKELSEELNVSGSTVQAQRSARGIPPKYHPFMACNFDWDNIPLGHALDSEIARYYGCCTSSVSKARNKREIPRYSTDNLPYRKMRLGQYPDWVIARKWGVPTRRIKLERQKLGIKSFRRTPEGQRAMKEPGFEARMIYEAESYMRYRGRLLIALQTGQALEEVGEYDRNPISPVKRARVTKGPEHPSQSGTSTR